MAHKDGVFCDEGFKCKKCKDAWGKLTEIEQLTARVRELETQLAANNPLLDEAANRIDELEEENARLRFALADTEAFELGTSERLSTITRQRDLAVEALEKQGHSAGCRKNAFGDICTCGLDDLLPTVKESEAMAQGEK